MVQLSFRLKNPNHIFSATKKSDKWDFRIMGKCEQGWSSRSFTVKCGDNSYDGFGVEAFVHIKKRPPRSEVPGISILKPFDENDEYRDAILVYCPDSEDDQPFFEISVSLPPDAYQRVIETDWTRNTLTLLVETGLREQALVSGHDPDGSEIEWLTDKQKYVFLEEVTVHFLSAVTREVNLEEQIPQNTEDTENTLTPVEQMLASVDHVIKSIGELRASIIRAAWVLGAVLVVTAFIR